MKYPVELAAAGSHLADAQVAYDGLLRTRWRNKAAFRRHWQEFLHAADGVFDRLSAISDGGEQYAAWLDQKIGERRSDPLLGYLQHARDHGRHARFSRDEAAAPIRLRVAVDGEPPARPAPSEADQIRMNKALRRLRKSARKEAFVPRAEMTLHDIVVDGLVYPAPGSHLGVHYSQLHPTDVARLALDYLQNLQQDALRQFSIAGSALPTTFVHPSPERGYEGSG